MKKETSNWSFEFNQNTMDHLSRNFKIGYI